MAYKLRPYQQQAIADMHRHLKAGAESCLIVAPTGAGKTVIGCHVIDEMISQGVRTIFFGHREELVMQCSGKLKENGVRHGVIKAGLDAGDLSSRVHVASIQTFFARRQFMRKDYRLIIFDEAHHAAASTWMAIKEHCGNPIVLGLTATPYRADGKGLADIFKSMVRVASTADLINWGFLVPPRTFRASTVADLRALDLRGGDYDERQLSRAVNRPRLNGHAVHEYIRLARGKRGLYFCVDVAHSKAVCEAFNAAGIRAEHVDGKTPAAERRAINERLHTGRTLIVTNCGTHTEGFDEPRVEVVGGLRPTKSRGLWRQMGGRGLRLAPDIHKIHALILDHAGWTDEHGYLTDPDICSLAGGLAQEKPKAEIKCPACGAQLASRPRVCPACGAALGTGEREDTVGLGDERFSLQEDAPFFGGYSQREPERPAVPYVPQAPSLTRMKRRSRGLS